MPSQLPSRFYYLGNLRLNCPLYQGSRTKEQVVPDTCHEVTSI
ncbi:hypothetical protein CsSME_00007619 [Camellia sinensis var. sinensis]